VRAAAAGQAEAAEDGAPAGSARWSEALSDLLPQFSGWRTPSAAPRAARDASATSAAGAGPGLPKVRSEAPRRRRCASRAAARHGVRPVARGRAARAREFGAQVALMFLTRGIIPYEDTWRQFLAAVPERVPGASAAGWRALFSVYVHLPPDLAYPEGSLFAGHEIAGRIAVEWGQWSVVRAPRPARPPPAPHAANTPACILCRQTRIRSRHSRPRRERLRAPVRYSLERRTRRPRRSACCWARRWRTRATSALCWSARRASRCTRARSCGRSWRASRARACTPAATAATPRTPAAAWPSGAPLASGGSRLRFPFHRRPRRGRAARRARPPVNNTTWQAGGDGGSTRPVCRPPETPGPRPRRWQPAMAGGQLQEEHWRKNGQWFSLTRAHAELVVADTEVADAFKRCGRAGPGRSADFGASSAAAGCMQSSRLATAWSGRGSLCSLHH
jgi:hypothetical protein